MADYRNAAYRSAPLCGLSRIASQAVMSLAVKRAQAAEQNTATYRP